ncbi:MAG: MarR family transcriptional regulator [Candidatus Bathyarchaeota archaeon]|nr:MarR family transcriptional regulator [Candidatus Bathyarchaeota archaeon]
MRKELAEKLLRELLNNSKRSDRELAKLLKVSQPTITRTRHKLEKSGMIQDYTITPDFSKMGFELLAITLIKMKPEIRSPEVFKRAQKYTEKFPNAIFAGIGEGLGMTSAIISFHHDFTDYTRKWNQMRLDWKDYILDLKSFIVSLEDGVIKRFSPTCLKDLPFKQR